MKRSLLLIASLLALGCAEDPPLTVDADAEVPLDDGGTIEPGDDGGIIVADASEPDGGSVETDAGTPETDAGVTPDAGHDAGRRGCVSGAHVAALDLCLLTVPYTDSSWPSQCTARGADPLRWESIEEQRAIQSALMGGPYYLAISRGSGGSWRWPAGDRAEVEWRDGAPQDRTFGLLSTTGFMTGNSAASGLGLCMRPATFL